MPRVPHANGQPLSDPSLDSEPSMSIQQFCQAENMSLATYHKLKRNGLGPDEVCFPKMRLIRITAAARREWHRRIEELRLGQANKLERDRRVAAAKHAAEHALKSGRHVSNRGKNVP